VRSGRVCDGRVRVRSLFIVVPSQQVSDGELSAAPSYDRADKSAARLC
jgi:hypothetical protein